MICETDIIARVETYVRHPVFFGSDEVMEGILCDLEFKAGAKVISRETFERLRDLIRRSPHFRNN